MDHRTRTIVVRVALSVAALGVVAFFLYRQRHLFVGFGKALAHADWWWVVLALAAQLASIIPLAESQRLVLRAADVRSPFVEMIAVTLASNAIATSVPAGVAVAEGYAYKRYKHFGAEEGVAAWAELAAGAIAFSALGAIALIGAIIDAGKITFVVFPIIGVVFAGSTAAAELFRHPSGMCDVVEWFDGRFRNRIGPLSRASKRLREIADDIDDVQPSLALWLTAYGLATFNWLIDLLCLAFAFVAFHGTVPWAAIFLAFAGTKVISSIGVTPGGLGIVEGGLVAVFVAFHEPPPVAAAAVVVYRGITLIVMVAIGWVLVGVLAAHGRHPHR
jgi:uncharacterized protein (TIRG00374 family)